MAREAAFNLKAVIVLFLLMAVPATAADDELRAAAEALTTRADRELERRTAESLPAAARLYAEAVELWRQLGDAAAEARTGIKLGRLHEAQGEMQQALAADQSALEAARRCGDRRLEAETLLFVGMGHCWLGDEGQAIARFQEALELLRRHPDKGIEADVLFHLGVAYERLGEYQEALERYHQVLPRFRAAGNRHGEAAALNNLGTVAFEMGRFRESRDFYGQVVELRREMGDDVGQARALTHVAEVDNELGSSQRALKYLQRALTLVRAGGDRRAEANTLNNLGLTWLLVAEPRHAREPLEQALALSREVTAPRIEAFSLRLLGRMHAALGQPAAAVERFAQAVTANRAAGHLLGLADALAALASQRRELGELDAALEAMREALGVLESLRTRTTRHELRTSFFSSRRAAYKLYVDLLMAKHRSDPGGGHDAAALTVVECSRARTLLDRLAEAGVDLREGVDPELLRHERELARRLDAREQERLRLRTASESTARIEAEIADLLDEFHRVQGRIRYHSPRYAALAIPEPVDCEAIRGRLLDRDTVLLTYLLAEKRSFGWAVTRDRLASRELPPRVAIEDGALRLYELLTARNRSVEGETPAARRQRIARADAAVGVAARALGRLVLEPLADELDARRLAVVGDGLLQIVPFAALPLPGSEEPLITRYEVVHLPSASALAVLRQRRARRPRATRELAVVADPVFRETEPRRTGEPKPSTEVDAERGFRPLGAGNPARLGRLRFSRLEAERIAALIPPGQATTFLDLAATKANILDPELGRYRLLHFATHALIDENHPELTALALSHFDERGEPQPGFLRLHEIYRLRLAAEVVTLSACETALGKPVDGEGLIGLVRGFFHAGADRVVASLWSVQDKATAELMPRFYRAMLVEGHRPAAALRQAQISLRTNPRVSAPYFWAPFVFQGEWR